MQPCPTPIRRRRSARLSPRRRQHPEEEKGAEETCRKTLQARPAADREHGGQSRPPSNRSLLFGGGDAPESYGQGPVGDRHQPQCRLASRGTPRDRADRRQRSARRQSRRRHSPERWVVPEPGIPIGQWLPGLWELPGKWGIPGTVWTPGTNLDFQTIARQLGTDGKPLESVEFFGSETGYLPYWEYWAGLSGGTALNGNNGEFASKLESHRRDRRMLRKMRSPASPDLNPGDLQPRDLNRLRHLHSNGQRRCEHGCDQPDRDGGLHQLKRRRLPERQQLHTGSRHHCPPIPRAVRFGSCRRARRARYRRSRAPTPGTPPTPPQADRPTTRAADELAAQVSFGSGTIALPDVDIPVVCWFPCAISGSLTTGPDLAKLSSVSGMTLESAALASSHGKKKNKKPKPLVLGSGKLTLGKANRSILVIKLTSKGRKALGHVGKKGVRLTLKVDSHHAQRHLGFLKERACHAASASRRSTRKGRKRRNRPAQPFALGALGYAPRAKGPSRLTQRTAARCSSPASRHEAIGRDGVEGCGPRAHTMSPMEGSMAETSARSWLRCYRCWSQDLEVQVHYEGIHKIDPDTGERAEVVDELQEAVVQCLDCMHDQPHLGFNNGRVEPIEDRWERMIAGTPWVASCTVEVDAEDVESCSGPGGRRRALLCRLRRPRRARVLHPRALPQARRRLPHHRAPARRAVRALARGGDRRARSPPPAVALTITSLAEESRPPAAAGEIHGHD